MSPNEHIKHPQAYQVVLADLVERFAGRVEPDEVARVLEECHAEIQADATIDDFTPVLTTHLAKERLNAMVRGASASAD